MPGADSFDEGIKYLSEQVGEGNITAGCLVNQPHAQNQHENLSFKHSVGRARYLGDPLMENALALMQDISDAVITETGSNLSEAMQDVAEEMVDYVKINAPKDPDIGDVLALSGSPYVIDGGIEVYRRGPIAPRKKGIAEPGYDS